MTLKEFTLTFNKIKRPLNYSMIVLFLLAIVVFPVHMGMVMAVLASTPAWLGILITSVIGGQHLMRTYRKEIMKDEG